MVTSEQINELAAALAKAQGEITGALKDSANPFFKSKYADLASCWDACRGPLSKNGLSVTQFPDHDVSGFCMVTTLMHSSGQWMRAHLPMRPKDDSPQALGSAITYARRYALAAVVGLAQVDDDAEAAMGRKPAYQEAHTPAGDLGKSIPEDKARAEAVAMIAIMEQDIDETVMALRVYDRHEVLTRDADLYQAASQQMSAKQRNAWKTLVSLAKAQRDRPMNATGRAA